MGGQACILYGGAEFSRDIDLAVAVSAENLGRLRDALAALEAEPEFYPPLSASVLRRGHACHFRCLASGLHRLRIDLMSRMRGVPTFSILWKRRMEIDLPGVGIVPVMSLADLLKAKKTQRDKDWPMIRRLVEADVTNAGSNPTSARIALWLREGRTFELLRELGRRFPREAAAAARRRPALKAALGDDARRAAALLRREEDEERRRDRRYWAPLRAELERWQLGRGG